MEGERCHFACSKVRAFRTESAASRASRSRRRSRRSPNRALPEPEKIHQIRKRCKKLRAVLRLVRPGLSEFYASENAFFRDAARVLSPLRDTQSVLDAYDGLMKRYRGEVARRRWRRSAGTWSAQAAASQRGHRPRRAARSGPRHHGRRARAHRRLADRGHRSGRMARRFRADLPAGAAGHGTGLRQPDRRDAFTNGARA